MTTRHPRLTNVMIRVADMERSLGFWRERLGLPVVARFESFAFLDAGGVRIGLKAVAPPKEPDGGLSALTEIVLEVPDVFAAHEELSARGVVFRASPSPVTGDASRELWSCDCRDPDGHLVSITGWIAKRQPS
jgi:catechol 2,3-dioxygenase-like lactoylglutathione lyase family enzyme